MGPENYGGGSGRAGGGEHLLPAGGANGGTPPSHGSPAFGAGESADGSRVESGSTDHSSDPSVTAGDGDGPDLATRDYDSSGRTISTDDLVHPNADLIDGSLVDNAYANPNRVNDALSPGAPSTHPEVQTLVTPEYDPRGGMPEEDWNSRYWPSGEADIHGRPHLVWPDPQSHPQGFATPESRVPVVLQPGEIFDRFGPGFGQFGSPPGTEFAARGLPPYSLEAGYHRYEVVRPIPVWQGPIAPALGQPGGGMQYYLPHAIVDLVNAGYLREVPL